MELIDTAQINNWPDDVILAISGHKQDLSSEILSIKEKQEFQSFKNTHRKSEYLMARHLFHFLLDEAGIESREVELLKEEKGKPYAIYRKQLIHVSFSHTKNLVMCAISRKRKIGLDTEAKNRRINDRVIKRFLNEAEWKAIGYENPLKLWTIKEAALKCVGTGLQTNLKNLSINKKEKNRYLMKFNNEYCVEICNISLPNHETTLAYQNEDS